MSRQIPPTDRAAPDTRSAIPDGVVIRCGACKEVLFAREHERSGRICPHCQHPAPLHGDERLRFLTDDGSFRPLRASGLAAGAVLGRASMDGTACAIGALGGSEGIGADVVNEALGALLDQGAPTVLFCAGGVGVGPGAQVGRSRAQAHRALARHGRARLPYVLVVTDPHADHGLVTGAPLGDIVVAETAARDMPAVTQPREGERAVHPFVDIYMPRADMKTELSKLLMFFAQAGESDGERPD